METTVRQKVNKRWIDLRSKGALLVGSLLLGAAPAMAQLPTTAPPSRGTTAGNYLRLIQDYAYDLAVLLGLALAALALFRVVVSSVGAYGEVQDGKGTWGQLGMNAGVGVLLVVFVIFLVGEASTIL